LGPSEAGNTLNVSDSHISTCRSGESNSSNRHETIKKWKEELEASGNLTKTVVNIETSLTNQVENVYDGVHNGPILGTGVAGIVRKCRHRQTGIDFAVKCLNIGLIENDAVIETLREEIFIMCQADHPDIIRLEEVYESDSQIYLILKLLTGGDMFDRLEEQPEYHYSEVQCAKIVKQMTSAVRYLHSNKVIHRDLKLENFLFDDMDSDTIRLIDFGLSKHFDRSGEKHNLAVGTPYTIAPEIIQGEYDEKVDVWALGVITYLLLCGETPFGGMDGESLISVRQNILDCKIVFEPKKIWDGVSKEAKNFIRRLLTRDPEKRPSACEAQHDEWIVKYANLDANQSKRLNPDLVKNLINFKDYSNLQKILLEVVSFTLMPDQIKDLKQEFEKADGDGSGEITLDELKEVLMNYNHRAGSDSSLGTLTEDEVELIFDSFHLNIKQTTIKWHNFITAGLSRCDYDDRNLRLAFNRLDHTSKGFITVNDLNEMLRSNDGSMDEVILEMWKDGMESIRCERKDRIYFEDFQCFFKGHAPKQQGIMNIDTVQENSETCLVDFSQPNRLSLGDTGRCNSKRRVSLASERILASTLSLGVDSASESRSSSEGEVNNDMMIAIGNDDIPQPVSARSSFRTAPRLRPSGCALLIKSRDMGILE